MLSCVLKGILFPFRAPSVTATALAIMAEVKRVWKALCRRPPILRSPIQKPV